MTSKNEEIDKDKRSIIWKFFSIEWKMNNINFTRNFLLIIFILWLFISKSNLLEHVIWWTLTWIIIWWIVFLSLYFFVKIVIVRLKDLNINPRNAFWVIVPLWFWAITFVVTLMIAMNWWWGWSIEMILVPWVIFIISSIYMFYILMFKK